MKTYVADFIPRFKRFSNLLDNETLLMNQHWVLLDQITSTKTVYIFQKNNRLLISKNGKVDKADWEMIDPKHVLVTAEGKSFMFNHGFMDEHVLALNLDGGNEYALFANQNKSSFQLNSPEAMETFLKSYYQKPIENEPKKPQPPVPPAPVGVSDLPILYTALFLLVAGIIVYILSFFHKPL